VRSILGRAIRERAVAANQDFELKPGKRGRRHRDLRPLDGLPSRNRAGRTPGFKVSFRPLPWLTRLRAGWSLLTGGARDCRPWQQTLRGANGLELRLLNAAEPKAFNDFGLRGAGTSGGEELMLDTKNDLDWICSMVAFDRG